jgi:flagellar FliL protein
VLSVVPSSWRVGTTDSHYTINRQNTRFLEHAVNGSGGTRLAPPCRSNVTVRRRPNASRRAETSIRRIRVKKIVIIAVAVLVFGAGGAGGWWWYSHRAQAAAGQEGEKNAKKAPSGESAAVLMEPFLVNLADKDASRFLRVSLQLVIDNKKLAAELGAKEEGGEHAVLKAKLRSAILELLTTKTSDHLVTPEGKTELKKEIAERASHVLHEAEVVDVLFTDFVVQF